MVDAIHAVAATYPGLPFAIAAALGWCVMAVLIAREVRRG